MQFSIFINQARAVEWGLNAQQAMLFAYVYGVPSWADSVVRDGVTFYRIDKAKILGDLPLLTDKIDTVYRLLKALADINLLEMSRNGHHTIVRLTEKALRWNVAQSMPAPIPVDNSPSAVDKQGRCVAVPPKISEKNPENIGKKSEKISEKNPTNSSLYINNPIIKHNPQSTYQDSLRDAQAGDVDNLAVDNSDLFAGTGQADPPPENPSPQKSGKSGYPDWFEKLWQKFPPRTGASDKRRALQCANARLAQGKTPDDLLAAVDRYARFVRATGKWGSQYVMQAQTFFGPGGHIENPWSYQHEKYQPSFQSRETAFERIKRQAQAIRPIAVACGFDGPILDADDSDLR